MGRDRSLLAGDPVVVDVEVIDVGPDHPEVAVGDLVAVDVRRISTGMHAPA